MPSASSDRGFTRKLVAAVAFTFLAAACARSSTGGSGGTGYAADDLVLRVAQSGGFIAPSTIASRLPQFSLYGDGRIVQPGAQMAIYPGPALPAIAVSRVDGDGFDRIVAAARAARLTGPDRHAGGPGNPDVPSTVVTFFDGHSRHTVTFNEQLDSPMTGTPDPIAAFLRHIGDLARWLPKGSLTEEGPMPIERLAVLVSAEPTGQMIPEPEIAWPLASSPAAMAEPLAGSNLPCLSLTGDALAKVLPPAEGSNQLTPWTSGSSRAWLVFRPLLPDERSCSALEPSA